MWISKFNHRILFLVHPHYNQVIYLLQKYAILNGSFKISQTIAIEEKCISLLYKSSNQFFDALFQTKPWLILRKQIYWWIDHVIGLKWGRCTIPWFVWLFFSSWLTTIFTRGEAFSFLELPRKMGFDLNAGGIVCFLLLSQNWSNTT